MRMRYVIIIKGGAAARERHKEGNDIRKLFLSLHPLWLADGGHHSPTTASGSGCIILTLLRARPLSINI